jgi:rod shape-determining protein MreC
VPRNRSARVATLAPPPQRAPSPAPLPSRTGGVGRRRAVVAFLVVASLALLSVYFRESNAGALHGLQSHAAAILRPFEVAGERVARPFEDAAHWFGGLVDARSDNGKLRKQIDSLRQQVIQNRTLAKKYSNLRRLFLYRESPRFPKDFRGIAADLISRPPSQFVQQIVVATGSSDGVKLHSPVVTQDGLVGQVTRPARNASQVTLLTDETSAVSVVDLNTGASGILRHGSASNDSLILDRVTKDQVVTAGDTIVTAGWRAGKLSSIYPQGIPVGIVKSVGQLDTDVYKQIEVKPNVDFSSLESVLVLVPAKPRR